MLINKGAPDLHTLLYILKEEKLISEKDYQELDINFLLDGVSPSRP
jgi:hypothetical protein